MLSEIRGVQWSLISIWTLKHHWSYQTDLVIFWAGRGRWSEWKQGKNRDRNIVSAYVDGGGERKSSNICCARSVTYYFKELWNEWMRATCDCVLLLLYKTQRHAFKLFKVLNGFLLVLCFVTWSLEKAIYTHKAWLLISVSILSILIRSLTGEWRRRRLARRNEHRLGF